MATNHGVEPREWDSVKALKLTILLSFLSVVACESTVESDKERRVGVVLFHEDPIVIDLPDTVYAGDPFDVAIRTYASGCDQQGPTETGGKEGEYVDMRPYDIFYTGPRACPAFLKMFDHRVNLILLKTGVWEFRFHGRALPGDSLLMVVREVVAR